MVSNLLLSGDNMHFDFSAGKLASSWTKKNCIVSVVSVRQSSPVVGQAAQQ